MATISFGDAVTIAGAVDSLIKHRGNLGKFLESFIDNGPSIGTLMETLTNDVVKGFDDVVSVLEDDTLQQEWAPISDTLNIVGDNLKSYQNSLTTVKKQTSGKFNGEYTIEYRSDTILFKDWCLGYVGHNGSTHKSRLDEMAGWVSNHTINNNTMASLVGILDNSAPELADSLGADGMKVWAAVVQAAQGYSNPAVLGKIANDTLFNSMIDFMNCINNLVQVTYYTHDSALHLLNLILKKEGKPASTRDSIKGAIDRNFGSYNSGGKWQMFSDYLDKLDESSKENPEMQYRVTAFTPGLYPTSANYYHFKLDPLPAFYSGPIQVTQGQYPTFFSALEVVSIIMEGEPTNSDSSLAVRGTVVELSPGLQLTTLQDPVPAVGFYSNPVNWNSYPVYGPSPAPGVLPPQTGTRYNLKNGLNLGTFNNAFPLAPTPNSNNHFTVITGFQFVSMKNGTEFNVALAIQFAQVDISDVSNPIINLNPDFVIPGWQIQNDVQEFYSGLPSGNYSSGQYQPGIITNASFGQIFGTNYGDNCCVVQMNPTLYKADYAQPTSLKPIAQH